MPCFPSLVRRIGLRAAPLLVIALLFCSLPATAQVLFDAASNSAATTGGATTAVSWSHTTGLTKKPYLTVGVSIGLNADTATVTSVLYGSEPGGPQQAMTAINAATNGTTTRAELWGLANPVPGTHTITVTVTRTAGTNTLAVVAGAKSFSNVFETSPTGAGNTATGNTTTPTVTLTNSAFDYVVDAVAYAGTNALTASANQTNTYDVANTTPAFSGAGSAKIGFANTTMSWTAGATHTWAAAAINLQPAVPQILFDAASSSSASTISIGTGGTSLSWNHTTTSAANRYIVVGFAFDLNGTALCSATLPTCVTAGRLYGLARYGTEVGGPNVAMTYLGSRTNGTNVAVELFGLTAPASGTHQITVTLTKTSGANVTSSVVAGAQSFSNVDQVTSTGTVVTANGTSAAPSVAVTNGAYDYVVDVLGLEDNAVDTGTPGTHQDTRWAAAAQTNATPRYIEAGSSGLRGYTNATMSWALSGTANWGLVAVPLKPVSVAVTKSLSADVVNLGGTITYTVTATNYSSASVNNVIITDAAPSGTSLVSSTGSCSSGSWPGSCNVGTLAAGASSSAYTLTVLPTAAGTITNSSTVSWNGVATTNESETVTSVVQSKVCGSPGKDGNPGTISGIINDYWPGSNTSPGQVAPIGATSVVLGARAAAAAGQPAVPGNTISAGDLLIIMQMQDATFDTTNDETYGDGTGSTAGTGTGSGAATALNNAGRWEYVTATNSVTAAGGTLTFTAAGTGGGLLYSYTAQSFADSTTEGQRTFQVIRVPQYTAATVGTTLTALKWNGSTGGVLGVDVQGTLTLNGTTGPGRATTTAASNAVVGSAGSKFTQLHSGDPITFTGDATTYTILDVTDDTHLQLTAQAAASLAAVTYQVPTISVSALGFRGGGGRQLGGDATAGLAATDFRTLATLTTNGSKGEGVAGTPRYVYNLTAIGAPGTNTPTDTGVEGYVDGSYGRGAPGNAGGGSTDGDPGGNDDNSGGGGGGNAGNGGAGGFGWNCRCISGGQGGGSISPTLTRVTMGGGGGAGTSNNGSAETKVPAYTDTDPSNGFYSSGATGGGVVMIRVQSYAGTGTIAANGGNAYNTGRDGSGGGGAGGSVLMTSQIGTLTGITIQARGGNGGSAWLSTDPGSDPGQRHGPGGGGGGGYVLTSSPATSTDISGGTNGRTNTVADPYGSQPGDAGVVQSTLAGNVLPGGGEGSNCAVADMAVTNTSPSAPVDWHSNIIFTQTVTNNGPNSAVNLVYTQVVPANSTSVSLTSSTTGPGAAQVTWTCGPSASLAAGTVITCTAPYFPPPSGGTNTITTFTFTTNVNGGAPFGQLISDTNTVSSSTQDSNPANNSATAGTPVKSPADLSVTLTNNAPSGVVASGTNVTYTSVVNNIGTGAATGGTWSMSVPAGSSFQSMATPAGWTCSTPAVNATTGTISCTANSSIASGGTSTFNPIFKATASAGNTVTGTANVSATNDTNTSNNSASSSYQISGAADMAVTLTNDTPTATPGGTITFTSTVQNVGPVATTNQPVWTMAVPSGLNFASMATPAGWNCVKPAVGATSGNITCTWTSASTFPPSTPLQTFKPLFNVNASTAAGSTITGTATIASTVDNVVPNNSAASSTLVAATGNADVAITKSASPTAFSGGLVTFTLVVQNNGPAIATNVTVSDPIPAKVLSPSASMDSNVGSCSGTSTITCTIPTLQVGGVATIYVIGVIDSSSATGDVINNTATVTADQSDPKPSNNSSSATTTVTSPTLAKLRRLDAYQDGRNVVISWATSLESDNLGFNVYRTDASGTRVKVNEHLIAGSAFVARGRALRSGYAYRIHDTLPDENAFVQYWLEDIDTKTTSTMHGPFTPQYNRAVAGLPADDVAPSFSAAMHAAASDAQVTSRPAANAIPGLGAATGIIVPPAGVGALRPKTLPSATAAQTSQQLDIAADQALKIYVSTEGWYRITKSDMLAAGFDPGTNPRQLALFSSGIEQPMVVNCASGTKFMPSDSIEFYGLGLDTPSTGARTYWLRTSSAARVRYAALRSGVGSAQSSSVDFTFERTDRLEYLSYITSTPDDQNFFGPVITTDPVSQDLTVANPDPSYNGTATLVTVLRGATDGAPHVVNVDVNGHPAGTATFIGLDEKTFTFVIPQSWLVAGANPVTFTATAGDYDISVLKTARLTYRHLLRADDGLLEFVAAPSKRVTVSGLTDATIRALDVTDPLMPTLLDVQVSGGGNDWSATFSTPSAPSPRTVLVFSSSRVINAPEMVPNVPSTILKNPRSASADLVIITNGSFATAAASLKKMRDGSGIATTVVDVDDIYDELNFGVRSPESLRAFLKSTTTWGRAPRYVVLLGGASIDPRNYLGLGSFDFVPTKLYATSLEKTASDDWFTDFNNDAIGDLAVGRFPARSTAEADAMIAKVTSRTFPLGKWSRSVVAIADEPATYDFPSAAAEAMSLIPNTFSKQTISVSASSSPHDDIVGAFNNGALLIDYLGHGSTEIWGDDVFNSTDAATLTNGSGLPVLIAMTCLNGYFHDVYSEALATSLLKSPAGGAVAVWASSTLTEPEPQRVVNDELMRQLFGSSSITLGDAMKKAKLATKDTDVRASWILFGDPSMRLK